MKYFVGEKEYKTIQGAKKEADKTGQDVMDEAGVKVYPDNTRDADQDAEADKSETPDTPELNSHEETVHGKVKRVFNGILRLRREPTSDDSAVCGATTFEEKTAVKKAVCDGHTYYQTADGYWVSGAEEHTVFIPD